MLELLQLENIPVVKISSDEFVFIRFFFFTFNNDMSAVLCSGSGFPPFSFSCQQLSLAVSRSLFVL